MNPEVDLIKTVLNAGVNYYIQGGSDRVFFELEHLLSRKGHRVIPFAANQAENRFTEWDQFFPKATNLQSCVPDNILRFIFSLDARKKIRQLIRLHRPDVAHLHIYYGHLTSSILDPLVEAQIPIVQTLHEYKLICPVYSLVSNGRICQECEGHRFWKALFKKCNRGSFSRSFLSMIESYVSKKVGAIDKINHFIAPSEFLRQKHIDMGLPAHKISTVPNFIDVSNVLENLSFGKYFLYFGRVEKIKGVFTLIEACSSIKTVPLLIAGNGEACELARRVVEQRKLDHIQFVGFQENTDLSKLIRGSICTIIPSEWYETFGMTILESFAHCRPVVASRIGGIPEVVTDGVDGLLFDAANSEQLREKLLYLAGNPKRANEMGMAGREKVEEIFNPDLYYKKTIEVYKKCLK